MAIRLPDPTPFGRPDVFRRHLTEVPSLPDEPDAALELLTQGPAQEPALDPFEFMPTEEVQGIGRITCLRSRFVQAPHGNIRQQQLLVAETDFGHQLMRLTHPGLHGTGAISDNSLDPDMIALIPGFSEMVEHGTAKAFHDRVAPYYPRSSMLSFATDGVSRYGPSLGLKEGWNKTFEDMATARRKLIRALGGNGSTTIFNVSMGAPITKRLALQNMYAEEDGLDDWINIQSLISISHALMPRVSAPRDIGKFILHMPVSGVMKAVHHPQAARDLVPIIGSLPRSAPAMAGNVRNLLGGFEWSDVAAVASTYPTGFIIGTQDPLRKQELCQDLAAQMPDQVRVKVCEGEGHAYLLDAETAAGEVVEMQRALAA